MSCIRKDDVGYSHKPFVESCVHGKVNDTVPRAFYAHTDHCDHYRSDYRDKGSYGHVRNGAERPGKSKYPLDGKADETKDDGTGCMLRDDVHHDAEGKNVRSHDKHHHA